LERRTQLPSKPNPEDPATYHVMSEHANYGRLHTILGKLRIHLLRRTHCGTGRAHIFTLRLHTYTCKTRVLNSTLDRTSFARHFPRSDTFLCHGSHQRSCPGGLFYLAMRCVCLVSQRHGVLSHGDMGLTTILVYLGRKKACLRSESTAWH
jgi:hypothetical protein